MTDRERIAKLEALIEDIDKLGCATIAMQRNEARELARKMFHVLQQMPLLPGDLMENWPDDPPRWLYDR